MINKLKQVIEYYGVNNQKIKTIEELAELSVEIAKNIGGKDNRDELVQELADVVIMITQMLEIMNVTDEELEEMMSYKINRTMERMKNE